MIILAEYIVMYPGKRFQLFNTILQLFSIQNYVLPVTILKPRKDTESVRLCFTFKKLTVYKGRHSKSI